MAKMKVHELAKELDITSKDVLAFLQDKGIEAKAAQSSVEESAVEMVRKAFNKKGETHLTDNKVTEEAKKEAPVVEEAAQKAATAEEAPKKKKKNIIFVSNPQNSKIPGGQKPKAPGQQGQSRPVQNQNRPGGYNNTGNKPAQAPISRPAIKPLTPPSPTPSVQMVKPQPQPKKEVVAETKEAQVQTSEATVKPEVEAPVRENRPERAQNTNNRPQSDRNNQRQGGFERTNDRGNRPDNRQGQDRNGQFNRDNRDNRGQGNRQGGYNRPEGGMQGRPGFNQGDRKNNGGKDFGGKDFVNKDFGGKDRDSRGGRNDGRQGDKFSRDNRSKNNFGGDTAPIKDTEKHREEEKRRISQEKDKRNKKDHFYEEEEALKNKPGRFIKPEKKKEEVVEEVIKVIVLPETITIKELAEKMKLQPSVIVKKLFMEGKIVTVNQEISYEDAENIAMEYDILCEKEVKVDVIEELLKEEEEAEEDLMERPPVICVMGHVDHGKTSLLDAIRKTNVTDKEAGGITQHIGAYTVNTNGRKITFLDTPGHEAFTAMRMRGATATDIAILVVAADDGVMPQTVEAINHAKAAGIEIIVAVNKIDKPSANIERVKQELTEYELIAEDWGGSTIFAPVSAKTGEGIPELLDMILLTADILELKANPNRQARGLVIEAELDKGRGPVATVLVQKGTLHVGDFISAGACFGKVRAMIDDKGRRVKEATPSTPVEILGLSDVPAAGEVFLSHETDKLAKTYAETYLAQNKEKMLEETKSRMSLDDLFSQIKEGNLKELNLIVKADVQGSVEAVKQSLMKLSNEEVVVKCIHGGVGAINESDVTLAGASNAIIIGFNVRTDATAKATAEREGVDVRLYKVIYQAIEDIQAAMKGMLDPIYEEKVIGHAEVRQIFKASAVGNIAGSYVLDGIFQRGCKIRISREGKQIYEGELASLKRFKDDVKEVKTGFECGLVFDGFDQMQELDIVEAYIMVEVPR
ncbi:MAG: translation initiation factor IF-2 [Lachnospiraceae bacterium]|nr:translation initiation factor IF-2 [Lachnospiraceae bacterium]